MTESTALSMRSYVLKYALIHIAFIAVMMLHFSIARSALSYVSLVLVGAFIVFFYVRPDYVLPIYGIHRRLMTGAGVTKVDNAGLYFFKRMAVWFFVIAWFPAFVILGDTVVGVAKIYILLVCAFISFHFSAYLFNNHQSHVNSVNRGEWMKLKQLK